MAYVLHFDTHMGRTQYDTVIAGSPPGRTYHVCYGDEFLSVTDVWDSMEQFQAFGQTLLPILTELGIDPGPPSPLPAHNVIA